MNFPLSRHSFAPSAPATIDFARALWLAANANHDAMHDPDAAVTIPVASDAAAAQIGSTVIDYARTAFGVQVRWQDETLVWPNGATLSFSVTGRAKIRGDRPSFIVQDEIQGIS